MSIGVSLLAIGIGAILKYAVTAQLDGINIATVGVILMVVGAIGLCISVGFMFSGRTARGQS
jgi:hypothetical protein